MSREKNGDPIFTIADRGFTATAWYAKDTAESQGDSLVEITKDGTIVRKFIFPTYKIYNIAAHFTDIVDSELTNSDEGYRLAAWNGIGPIKGAE